MDSFPLQLVIFIVIMVTKTALCGPEPVKCLKNNVGDCPKQEEGVKCEVDADAGCVCDEDCSELEKCCHDGCRGICKIADHKPKPGECPKAKSQFGICLYDPNKNCYFDDNCNDNMKCCPEGCGMVCKIPIGISSE